MKFKCKIFNDDETIVAFLEDSLSTCRSKLKSLVVDNCLTVEDVKFMNHATSRLEIENRLIDGLVDQVERDLTLQDLQSFYYRKMSKDYNSSKNWKIGIEVIDE